MGRFPERVGAPAYRHHMDGPPIVATTQLRPDPYSSLSRSIGIVDANAILSSVDNDCRYGRNSRLLRSTLFGCTTLYAADHVYREVYEKLPKIARSSPISLEELRARFETQPTRRTTYVYPGWVDGEPRVGGGCGDLDLGLRGR